MLQVISSVTSNKQCVSNIADANVLQFVLLVLHMLPSCECMVYTLIDSEIDVWLYQEYIINGKRVSNASIPSVECMWRVMRLECQ